MESPQEIIGFLRDNASSDTEPLPLCYLLTPGQMAVLAAFEATVVGQRLGEGDPNPRRDVYTNPRFPHED